MPNILPMIEADTVSFVLHRDREALAGVMADARIAESDHGPLADEESRPDPSQAEARKQLDPIVAEPLDETRLPDEVAFDDGLVIVAVLARTVRCPSE